MREMQTISRLGPIPSVVTIRQVRDMSLWQIPTFIICVSFWRRDVSDLEMLSRWQLAALIIFVRFWRRNALDLWMLYLEVDWVIVEILSSATPLGPAAITICQGRGMSWLKWSNLVSCVGFRKLDGSDL